MEMVPMMTQPQDTTALVPSMAAADNSPSGSPRLLPVPVHFAALLQDLLPPAQAGTEPTEITVKLMPTGEGAITGKCKAGIDPATGLGDDNGGVCDQPADPAGSQLILLLAMAGQLPAVQSRPQPAGQVASQTSELMVGGLSNYTGMPGEGTRGAWPVDDRLAINSAALDAQDRPLTLHQPRQTAEQQAVLAGAGTAGQAGEPEQSLEEPGSRVQPTGQVQSSQAVDVATLSKLMTAAQEGRESLHLPDTGGTVGNPANLQVEVVFTDPSVMGSFSEGDERRDPGAKEKGKESPPGLGVSVTSTSDTPGSIRFAPQPKVEEPRNALHDTILSQVRENSVVSHDGKGNGTIRIRLSPEDLGELQINLRIENQRVKVEVITENRTVRDALMGNLDNLKEILQKQNLNMERFDVSSGGGNGFGQGFRDERGDLRHFSSLPFGHEALPIEIAREHGIDDWGVTENSLVNLRL